MSGEAEAREPPLWCGVPPASASLALRSFGRTQLAGPSDEGTVASSSQRV
jgi:hypothetical protein